MADTTRPRADACIDALPGWQQAFCGVVRQLVHAADSQVTEAIERTDRSCLVLEGCIRLQGASSPAGGIITGGHVGKADHTGAVRYGEAVAAPALIALFGVVIADDRVGG